MKTILHLCLVAIVLAICIPLAVVRLAEGLAERQQQNIEAEFQRQLDDAVASGHLVIQTLPDGRKLYRNKH